MMEERREKAFRAMVGVLFVFGIVLVYFLFFNSGLELLSFSPNPEGKVMVKNVSVHAIRDVTVSFVKNKQKTDFQTIPLLYPQQQVDVSLSPDFVWGGKLVIQVSAPFHLGKQIMIDAQNLDPSQARVSFSFKYPDKGIVGHFVVSAIEACSQENFSLDLVADLNAGDASLAENPPSLFWSVSPVSCRSVSLSFVPLKAVENLPFKIRVFTRSSVIAEREFGIPILPSNAANSVESGV